MAKHKEFKAFWFETPADLHDDSIELVGRFATAMAQKLAKAQRKYGYSNNWKQNDWMGECQVQLYRHIKKGDPLDVAIYSAFLWHHGKSTSTAVRLGTDCDEIALAVARMFTPEGDPQGRARMQCAVIAAIRNPALYESVRDLRLAAKHCENMLMRYGIDRINGDEIEDEALDVIRAALAKGRDE